MGVHAYTERVPLQLLDFAYRYTNGILSDAINYDPPSAQNASASNKKASKDDSEGVSLNALRTAVAARAAVQFNTALPKEYMNEIATERNRNRLPPVEREFGVRLPPERYCFTGVGWDMRESWEEEVSDEEIEGGAVQGLGAALAGGDTVMGGMEEEDVDEDQFEEVMGGDASMTNG